MRSRSVVLSSSWAAARFSRSRDGVIDFGAVLKSLRRVGSDGYITIELYPYAEDPDFAARTARERVLEIIRKLDTP